MDRNRVNFDPEQIRRAVIWAYAVAAVFIGVGTLFTLDQLGQVTRENLRFTAVFACLWLGPGLLYLLMADFLRRGRGWALYVLELATWLQMMFLIWPLWLSAFYSIPLMTAFILWLVVMALGAHLLNRCTVGTERKVESRGFEPVMSATTRRDNE